MSLAKHAGDVAPPVAARPSQTLFKELGIIFKSGLDLSLILIVVPDCLIMRD